LQGGQISFWNSFQGQAERNFTGVNSGISLSYVIRAMFDNLFQQVDRQAKVEFNSQIIMVAGYCRGFLFAA
jgi:hypothetical protein